MIKFNRITEEIKTNKKIYKYSHKLGIMTLVCKPRLQSKIARERESQDSSAPPFFISQRNCVVSGPPVRRIWVSPCAPSALSSLLPLQQSQNHPRPASLFPAQPPPRQLFSPRKTFYTNGGSGGSLSRLEELRVMEPGCCLGPQPSPLR